MKPISLLLITLICCPIACLATSKQPLNPKPHEMWWTHNAERIFESFNGWLGDMDITSRVLARNYIREKGYTSLLDVPSGTCTEYFGLQRDNIAISYTGLDITDYLVKRAQIQEINVHLGSIEAMPFKDSSFEIVYLRHILEHLDYYELALTEAIRTASKEVLVVFFKNPSETNPDLIDLGSIYDSAIYHNRYNKQKLESFVLKNPKVKSVTWRFIGGIANDECFLHIYLH